MRRIQLYIEEELDDRLGIRAARTGVSKASLIREAVAERYADAAPQEDPLDSLIGSLDLEPGDIDEVVYGPAPRAKKSTARARKGRRQ